MSTTVASTTAVSAAPPAKATDLEEGSPSETFASVQGGNSDTGRIQVAGNRSRKFYVFAAKRLLSANPGMQKVHITALGSAITCAIGTAHNLSQDGVAYIADVQTYYQPLEPSEVAPPPAAAAVAAVPAAAGAAALPRVAPKAAPKAAAAKPALASANGRSIARILIVVMRNKDWIPGDELMQYKATA